MTGPHFHVLDGAVRWLYGTYPDQRQAERQARHIRRTEDIDAWVYGACHDYQCRYGGSEPGSRPVPRTTTSK